MASSARAGRLFGGLRRFLPLLAIAIMLVAALSATPAGAVDLAGTTTATFGWTAASGPVGSYRVFVARNSSTFPSSAERTVSSSTRTVTVSGAVGERIQVRIAAVSSAGTQGPYSPASVEVRFVSVASAPAVVNDLDDDGRADLILRQNSGGSLSARSISSTTTRSIVSPPATQGAVLVDAGDYDGNGVSDLLWRTSAGEIRLCLNDKVAADDCRTIGYAGPGYMVNPAGDVNGDGRRDILFQAMNAPALLCLGAPNGLATCANLSASLPTSYLIEAGDTTGDKRGDLLVWYLGTGQIKTCSISSMALSGCSSTLTLASGWAAYPVDDLNADGRADLMMRSTSGTMMLCPRSGTALACVAYSGPTTAWTYLGSADYDGDARPDLIFRDFSTGNVSVRLLNGTAAKGSPIVISIPTGQQVLVF